jgi:penicillin-binding protein 1A
LALPLLLLGWQQGLALLIWAGAWGGLPSRAELAALRLPLASEVISIDGQVLGRYYLQNRSLLSLDSLPPKLAEALVSTEDLRFYRHSGSDPRSMARVAVKTLLLGESRAGGGSTLTQQLAKNLYPRTLQGWLGLPVNKTRETLIARRLERLYSKDELLMLYLNTVFWGEGAWGLGTAARRYFSKPASRLKLEESALLVAMLKGPSAYNPRREPERALARRNLVLRQMQKYGYLPARQADSLAALPLQLRFSPEHHHTGAAPYFREMLRLELERHLSGLPGPGGRPWNLYTDGLKIRVTLHSAAQAAAEQAVSEEMRKIQQRFERQWNSGSRRRTAAPILRACWEKSARCRSLKAAGASPAELDSALGTPIPMRIFTWGGPRDTLLSPYDSILHDIFILHAGFLALEPLTGQVRAWVGGIDHRFYQYDHVEARRQAGSVFKPLVYAAALEQGIPPCEYIPNDPIKLERYGNWSPENADRQYGGEYSMAGGLSHSVNIVAVNLLMQTGFEPVIRLARQAGLEGPLPESPSLALGAGEVSLREMAGVYGAFVNGGRKVSPVYLLSIEGPDGQLVGSFAQEGIGDSLMRESSAAIMAHLLSEVVDAGTASSLRTRYGLRADIAGKTGTSQSQADGWFIGASPSLVAGAWVGAEYPAIHFRSLALGQGASTALPIWGNFFKRISRHRDFRHLERERFPALPDELQAQLDCESLWFPLSMSAFQAWWRSQQPDSAAAE